MVAVCAQRGVGSKFCIFVQVDRWFEEFLERFGERIVEEETEGEEVVLVGLGCIKNIGRNFLSEKFDRDLIM